MGQNVYDNNHISLQKRKGCNKIETLLQNSDCPYLLARYFALTYILYFTGKDFDIVKVKKNTAHNIYC